MKKYKGNPIVHDYWFDDEELVVFAIVEWKAEEEKEKKSNLILHIREYHDDYKKI